MSVFFSLINLVTDIWVSPEAKQGLKQARLQCKLLYHLGLLTQLVSWC